MIYKFLKIFVNTIFQIRQFQKYMLSSTLSQRYIRKQSLVTKYRLFSIQNAFEIAHLPSLINCLKAQLLPFTHCAFYGLHAPLLRRLLPNSPLRRLGQASAGTGGRRAITKAP